MGRRWVDILTVKGAHWRVPDIVVGDLTEFVESAEQAQAVVNAGDAGPATRHRRDRLVADMVAYMRDVRNRYFFIPPMNEEDFIELGLPLHDTTRTDRVEVTEQVDFVLEIDGPRQIHVRFWQRGLATLAKPAGYDGAVLDWEIRDTPPDDPHELHEHTMASRTPFTLQFREEDRGRIVYVALRWQNERGITGPWSNIGSSMIP
jgi:hypothetical protein